MSFPSWEKDTPVLFDFECTTGCQYAMLGEGIERDGQSLVKGTAVTRGARGSWTPPGGARRGGEVHFDGNQLIAGFDEEIDFDAGRGAPEVDARFFAAIEEDLDDLEKDGGFKDSCRAGSSAKDPRGVWC